MLNALTLPHVKFSRFDATVSLIVVGLALATGLLLWRGDRVGVQVVQVSPVEGSTGVSTRAVLQVTFDQTMSPSKSDLPLTISPPVEGEVRWDGHSLIFSPAEPLAPETLYTVTLAETLTSQQGRPVRGLSSWQFRTRQPRLLYVAPDADDHDQIFSMDPAAGRGEPVQLTVEPLGVFDFALAPDGATLAYAALREDGGSDLWAVSTDGHSRTPLLTCSEAICNAAAWSPDGRRLVYERRTLLVPGGAPGPPRLWWLNPASGDSVPVFDDNQIIGYGAVWSPDGHWLSYVAPSSQGVQIYNVDDGRSFLVPSRMGGLAVWSPDSTTVLVADIQPGDAGFSVHLLKAVPQSGQLADISGEAAPVEDGSPVWSPDGAWIAFTRKAAGASMGKQIWLMRADGSQARYLTAEPDIHHGLPAWSPDGRYLVFQRFHLKELGARPSIWRLEVETGQMQELVAAANRPVWLP
jgi:TolB protein